MSSFSIQEKVTVITGSTGVLGNNLSGSFAKGGAQLVLLGRDEGKIEKMIEELAPTGSKIVGKVCDVLNVTDLKRVGREVMEEFGKIDVLINVAGGNVPGATQAPDQQIFDLDFEDIDSAIELNLHGSLYPSLVFGKMMAETGRGSIINISSMAAYNAISRVMAYSIAKSGINALTKWMACEMARKYGDKVRVNAVAPGFFIGNQNRKLLLNEDGSLTERSETILAKTPMSRFGQIEEVNGAVQFLCSDAASFVTGIVLPVDGGFSAFSGV